MAEFSNSSSSSSEKKLPDEGLTENELKDLEKALLKELTPSQTKEIMKIFRGLRQGATSKETEDALVS